MLLGGGFFRSGRGIRKGEIIEIFGILKRHGVEVGAVVREGFKEFLVFLVLQMTEADVSFVGSLVYQFEIGIFCHLVDQRVELFSMFMITLPFRKILTSPEVSEITMATAFVNAVIPAAAMCLAPRPRGISDSSIAAPK